MQTTQTATTVDNSFSNLWDVAEVAAFLGMSESWVRRHIAELPAVRTGRAIRFDAALLRRQFSGTMHAGKPLKPSGEFRMVQLRWQQGHVYRRGKQKIWYGRFREDIKNPDGEIIRRTRNVRLGTLTELPSKASAVMRLQSMLAVQKPRTAMTFTELHTRWQVAEVPTIKRTTANYYEKLLSTHILPVFGNREVSRITREDVQRFLAEQAPKYSKNTLRGMRVSLGKVLTWAVEQGWLEKNPCAKLKLPNAGVEEIVHKSLKPEQVAAIASKLREPYCTLVLFLAVTGLRIGEAIGIKWSDFDGDLLRVSRTIYEGKAQAPKTKNSVRSIPIPAVLLSRLRALGGGEYVFRSREGTPIHPGNALNRYIRPVAKALGITLNGWHAFRRTLATHLLRRGESAKLVSGILGNSVEILLNDYDLAEPENYRVSLELVANQLLPVVTNSASGD